jgi:hypothetical protein
MRSELAQSNGNSVNGALLEKVILGNDLSGLSSIEKVQYVKNICDSVGINPITRPIQLLKFQGKEIPYFSKDATEQLRKVNKISLSITESKVIDDMYIVIVEATDPGGRKDSSSAAITIGSLKGEAKANAMMKCETKAKRRVTLSICGLGFIDESEAESIQGAKKISLHNETANTVEIIEINEVDNKRLIEDVEYISQSQDISDLQARYVGLIKEWQKAKNMEAIKQIIAAKDKRKSDLEVEEFQAQLHDENGVVNE